MLEAGNKSPATDARLQRRNGIPASIRPRLRALLCVHHFVSAMRSRRAPDMMRPGNLSSHAIFIVADWSGNYLSLKRAGQAITLRFTAVAVTNDIPSAE